MQPVEAAETGQIAAVFVAARPTPPRYRAALAQCDKQNR